MPPLVICFDRLGNLAGITAGYCFAYLAFGSQTSAQEVQLINPVVPCIAVFVLVSIQAFVLRNNQSYQFVTKHNKVQREPGEASDIGPWKAKCESFARAHRLSSRESEILLLLGKGRDANYIKDNMFISKHTVDAHIYNIYRKTNVHSRQELISRVESYQS